MSGKALRKVNGVFEGGGVRGLAYAGAIAELSHAFEFVNVGGEVSYNDMVFLRAGYKQLFLSDTEEGLSAGIGVSYPLFDAASVMIDYTYQDFGKFDFVQTVTLGITF